MNTAATAGHQRVQSAYGRLSAPFLVPTHSLDLQQADADASLAMERHVLDEIIMGTATLADLMSAGDVVLRGDADVVRELFGLLDTFELWFNIVEP